MADWAWFARGRQYSANRLWRGGNRIVADCNSQTLRRFSQRHTNLTSPNSASYREAAEGGFSTMRASNVGRAEDSAAVVGPYPEWPRRRPPRSPLAPIPGRLVQTRFL
jgi:hypothetical protein